MGSAVSTNGTGRIGIKIASVYCLVVGVGSLAVAIQGSLPHVALVPIAVAAAYGLWTFTLWGQGAAIVLFAVEVVRSGLAALAGDIGAILTIALSLVIIWYLYRKRANFG